MDFLSYTFSLVFPYPNEKLKFAGTRAHAALFYSL